MHFISFNCSTFVSSSLYSCCSNDVLRHRKYLFIRDKSNSNRNIKLKHIYITSSNFVTTFNSGYSSNMKNESLFKSRPTPSTLLHFPTIISSLFQSHSRFGDQKPPPNMSHFHPTRTIRVRIICIFNTNMQSRKCLPCPAHFVMTSSRGTQLHIARNFRITSTLTRVSQTIFERGLYR